MYWQFEGMRVMSLDSLACYIYIHIRIVHIQGLFWEGVMCLVMGESRVLPLPHLVPVFLDSCCVYLQTVQSPRDLRPLHGSVQKE